MSKSSSQYYKPEGLNRLIWLIAKDITTPDSSLPVRDNIQVAMIHSGFDPEKIQLRSVAYAAIKALSEYHQHIKLTKSDLQAILKEGESDYQMLTDPRRNETIALRRIITVCVKRIADAPLMDKKGAVMINLMGPDIQYDKALKVFSRLESEKTGARKPSLAFLSVLGFRSA